MMWGDIQLVAFFNAVIWKLTPVSNLDHDPLERCQSTCIHLITCFTSQTMDGVVLYVFF